MQPDKQAKNKAISAQEELSFTWWLVFSWLCLTIRVPINLMMVISKEWGLSGIVFVLLDITLCIYMLKYNRYAFAISTFLGTPFFWIINWIYLKNRWEHPKVVAASVKEKVLVQKHTKSRHVSDLTSQSSEVMTKPMIRPSDSDYARIANEITSGNVDAGLWTRLFVETDGDENQTKARYIKARIASFAEAVPVNDQTAKDSEALPDEDQIIWLPASSLALQRDVEHGYLNRLYANNGGWTLSNQTTLKNEARVFDKLEIALGDGRTKTVWFDITEAWKKSADK